MSFVFPHKLPADDEECFRVRGIPLNLTKSDAAKHVQNALGLPADTTMRIRSLAPAPYPDDDQMATVDFDTRLERLSRDNPTREWQVTCSCEECTADESGLPLTVDAHFKDITVLYSPKEGKWGME